MTKYVIGPDVALRLAQERAVMGDEHRLLAPTLLRSQLLSQLCQAAPSADGDQTASRQPLSARDSAM